MNTHARVVIVGGGIMGVGLLYHLALEGWRDVVLVEKGELTSGSTWHAAGQCPHFISSLNAAKLHVYGTQLYPKLEALTGHAVSWHGCGGLRLACSDEELHWFKQVHGVSKLAGYEAHIIGPDEIARHHPFIDTKGVKAAFLTVTDGHVAPADATSAMAAGARAQGAEIHRRTRVTGISLLETGEWLVSTDQGDIRCEHVVNAAGSYCDVIAGWTGHRARIANMLHHYVITEPVPQLMGRARELPIVRDPWAHCYFRQETGGILLGPYETSGAHPCWDGAPAWDFESELVAPELDRLTPFLERAAERFPLFAEVGLKHVISGAIPHTPDGAPLSGPAHGARNYWMHCGAALGICQAAGAGKYLAQWMVHGQAEISTREFDPRRFGAWETQEYAREVGVADYQHMYYCYKPAEQHAVGRGLRKSSLYDALSARGAQFSQVFGWERARWYDRSGVGEIFSFKRSNWWNPVRDECLAVRQRVGLMDLSTFAKFDVAGPDAFAFLQRICANNVPAADGRIMLGHLLNENGFVLSEITVTRLAADRFYVVSAAVAQHHDLDQLRWRIADGERVSVTDVTDDFGVLVLAGPHARDVLAACTDADLGNAMFRWLIGKEIEVAGVGRVRALRVNYVGELGWELHIPMTEMPTVFDALMRAGDRHGIALFGTYAMNSLRMEKAYRAWGEELTNEVTLIAADMERFVASDKDFIGKAATLRARQKGPPIKLVCLAVESVDNDCYGNEPIYCNDRLVGVTTGGAYGHAVGMSLAFGYVEPDLARADERFEVLMMGRRCAARVLPRPAWDPDNVRLKA
ncbi:MAG TPA: FAD-dependent oxidoreductase [Acetobacteraceae bacterium]|jgi:dimethylglycine dehydrogenase|nr:FAD-dependent oxidoreductase [Acetobacteraceae bacterium]